MNNKQEGKIPPSPLVVKWLKINSRKLNNLTNVDRDVMRDGDGCCNWKLSGDGTTRGKYLGNGVPKCASDAGVPYQLKPGKEIL